eukprot:6191237-Pleurochrysis_carterae.AAC.2
MAVPEIHSCGRFAAKCEQKSQNSACDGRACIRGCCESLSPDANNRATVGALTSSLSRPRRSAKLISACGSNAFGCAKAGDLRCWMPSTSNLFFHSSRNPLPGSMMQTAREGHAHDQSMVMKPARTHGRIRGWEENSACACFT